MRAWCWFNPDSKDPVGAVMVSAAYAMGRKGFTDDARVRDPALMQFLEAGVDVLLPDAEEQSA